MILDDEMISEVPLLIFANKIDKTGFAREDEIRHFFTLYNLTTGKVMRPFITGPPNGPLLFCTLSSVGVVCRLSSVVCNVHGRSAAAVPGAWPVRRPTLHGGTVRLRPVRASSCYSRVSSRSILFVFKLIYLKSKSSW